MTCGIPADYKRKTVSFAVSFAINTDKLIYAFCIQNISWAIDPDIDT